VGSRGPVACRRRSCGPATEEDFRRRIEFIATVPLFARMPKAQYPMLARVLKAKRWESGEVVLESGQARAIFFLIAQGWAEMQLPGKAGDEASVRLQPGDYFGDALLTERTLGKVVAGAGLVTLSMKSGEFKHFDLMRYLRGARRRAVGRPGRVLQTQKSGMQRGALKSEQRVFVADAVRRNANLRSLVGLREELVEQICDACQREEVLAGTEVVHRGEYGGRFYIVESGSFELRIEDADEVGGGAVPGSKSEMMQRMRRKEHFLQSLVHAQDQTERDGEESSSMKRTGSVVMEFFRTQSDENFVGADDNDDDHCGAPLCRMTSDPCGVDEKRSPSASPKLKPQDPAGKRYVDRICTPRCQPQVMATQSSNNSVVLGVRRSGDSFGEMALLYHAPRTSTAVAREDSVVWCVDQDSFRRIMLRKAQVRVERVARELDMVDIFQGLLSHEKLELAQNFLTLTFKGGDWIVRQGEFQNVWYVLVEGECCMSRTVGQEEEELATLRPVHHFGERALLREAPSELSVRVISEAGARCLVLDGPTFKELAGLLGEDSDFRRAVEDDLLEFARYKGSQNPKFVGLIERLEQAKGKLHIRTPSLSQLQLDPTLGKRALDSVGLLGVGAFGSVTLERDPQSGKLYALKTLSKGLIQHNELQESVQNEREIMTMIDSPFTLRLYGTFKDENYVYFLLEPLLGGDLHFLIRSPETSVMLRRPTMHKFLMACVVCGLEHLHERNIVFRDLKSENVLLSSRGYAKLCDFGFAKFVLGRTFTLCGTPEYVAPEVIEPVGYDRMVDWWALGVLTFEVISGDTPFSDEAEEGDPSPVIIFHRVMAGIEHVKFTCHDAQSRVFITALLQRVPGKRLGIGGAKQVKRHPFFKRIDFGAMQKQELEAPYVPPLAAEDDMSMFDSDGQDLPEFIPYVPDDSAWDAGF